MRRILSVAVPMAVSIMLLVSCATNRGVTQHLEYSNLDFSIIRALYPDREQAQRVMEAGDFAFLSVDELFQLQSFDDKIFSPADLKSKRDRFRSIVYVVPAGEHTFRVVSDVRRLNAVVGQATLGSAVQGAQDNGDPLFALFSVDASFAAQGLYSAFLTYGGISDFYQKLKAANDVEMPVQNPDYIEFLPTVDGRLVQEWSVSELAGGVFTEPQFGIDTNTIYGLRRGKLLKRTMGAESSTILSGNEDPQLTDIAMNDTEPTGYLLLESGDVRVFDQESDEIMARVFATVPGALRLELTASHLGVVTSEDIRFFDKSTRQIAFTLPKVPDALLATNEFGEHVLIQEGDRTLLYDVSTGAAQSLSGFPGGSHVALTPDARYAAVLNNENEDGERIRFYSIQSGAVLSAEEVIFPYELRGNPLDIAFSADGDYLFVVTGLGWTDAKIFVYRVRQNGGEIVAGRQLGLDGGVSLVYDSHTDNRYSPYISYDVGENLSFAFSASFGRAFGVYSLHGYTRDDQWYNPFLDDAYR